MLDRYRLGRGGWRQNNIDLTAAELDHRIERSVLGIRIPVSGPTYIRVSRLSHIGSPPQVVVEVQILKKRRCIPEAWCEECA